MRRITAEIAGAGLRGNGWMKAGGRVRCARQAPAQWLPCVATVGQTTRGLNGAKIPLGFACHTHTWSE
jgi:hypothetical protein